jgi:hypothetical protein
MTLDIVELVMAIEEGFGIELENIELENLETVGDLHAVILKAQRTDTKGVPWSALVMLFEEYGAPPGSITPQTRFIDLPGLD